MKAKIALTLVLVFALAQFVPLDRTNPPVDGEAPASDEVREVLRRSCYDCHSHETRWPWYAHVAPVSWWVVYDVHEAREHLNFSAWNAYDAKKRAKNREEVWEEVEEGEMPRWYYLPLHPDARLGDRERELLRAWAHGAG